MKTRSCRKQKLVVLALVFAGALLLRAESKPGPDLNEIKANWRVNNLVESGVWLVDARPEKLFNWAGEPVRGRVTLCNSGDKTRKLKIKAWLEQDLDRVAGRQEKGIELAPGATQAVEFEWPAKEVAYYGQSMLCEIIADGQTIARGGDCFGVARNLWEICIGANHPYGPAGLFKDHQTIEQAVETCRDKYLNVFEEFFWAPDDFGNLTPDKAAWYSGQTRYPESRDNLKYLCEYGLKIGVLPTTYGKSIGSGSGARDLIRLHPEYVYGYGNVMSFSLDTETLVKWDKDSEKPWAPTMISWAFYNMNDPAVVQHGINEIIESSRQYGWAGVRFDGHFAARSGRQRVGDQFVEFSADMADRQTAANQKALKEQALKVFPRYAFGYNYAEYSFDKKLESNPRESIELCSGDGYIMDESINSIQDSSNPYNRWADFALLLVREAEQVRRLGGHLAPILTSGQDPLPRYKAIMAYAAGAHPVENPPYAVKHPYNRFATRYSGLIWNKDLRNVWNPNGLVLVKPSVMWEPFVRELDPDASHKRLIVHLVNPPPHESAIGTRDALEEIARRAKLRKEIEKTAAAKKEAPDTGELDRLPPVKVLPDPQKDVAVRIVPAALRGKWTIRRALLLDPENLGRQELKVDTADPYFNEVRVPELNLWAVIVLDLEGKE